MLALVIEAGGDAQAGSPSLVDIVLRAGDGSAVALASVVRAHRLTAVVFFSATCPCFAAHRPRLAELARDLEPRGVHFVVVDSERHAAGERPVATGESGLPILRDDGALLARRLDARYATEAFVFDTTAALRYRGGFDSDRKYLSAGARMDLRDALVGLLRGTAPPFTSAKALGCVLRLR